MISVSIVFLFSAASASLILFCIAMGWWEVDKRDVLLAFGAGCVFLSVLIKLISLLFI